ncbi:MAG: hypothetical protein WCR65_01335 [Parcubacteria group bacterium]|jgi:hypothetical protein
MKKKDFIEENEESLKGLAERVNMIRDCMNIKDEKELFGRQYAIEIIDGWMTELFNFNTEDLKPLSSDNDLDIYKYREEVEHDM